MRTTLGVVRCVSLMQTGGLLVLCSNLCRYLAPAPHTDSATEGARDKLEEGVRRTARYSRKRPHPQVIETARQPQQRIQDLR